MHFLRYAVLTFAALALAKQSAFECENFLYRSADHQRTVATIIEGMSWANTYIKVLSESASYFAFGTSPRQLSAKTRMGKYNEKLDCAMRVLAEDAAALAPLSMEDAISIIEAGMETKSVAIDFMAVLKKHKCQYFDATSGVSGSQAGFIKMKRFGVWNFHRELAPKVPTELKPELREGWDEALDLMDELIVIFTEAPDACEGK